MYASYFGLARPPFSIAPDPRGLYMSGRHREALAHLLFGLQGGGGFVLLTGEIGAGKTTVCRAFLEQVPANCDVAYIFNPKLTVGELLQTIHEEFHLPPLAAGPGGTAPGIKDRIDALNAHLLAAHAAGRNSLLVIDEAQNLAPEVLEQLRLLTNLETTERKLLQIVLIGQPELRGMLARPDLEQLAQRVIARFHLGPLSADESVQYIAHRMTAAGLQRALPFDAAALREIHALTRGVPRRINLLCDRALLGAWAHGRDSVDRAIVRQAAAEVFGAGQEGAAAVPPRRTLPLLLAALGGGLAVGGLLWGAWAWQARSALARAASAPRVAVSAPLPAASGGAAPLAASAASGASAASAGGATSAAAAAGPQATPVAPVLDATAWAAALAAAPHEETQAWRHLAAAWQPAPQLPEGVEPCESLRRQHLACLRLRASLALLRQTGRPALLPLRDATGRTVPAVLDGLGTRQARLHLGGQALTVPLPLLAAVWQGDAALLWRPGPDGSTAYAPGDRGPAVAALAARLARALGQPAPAPGTASVYDAALRAQVQRFQGVQGLVPDGIAGPGTLMQLQRALGADEPRLADLPDTPDLPGA